MKPSLRELALLPSTIEKIGYACRCFEKLGEGSNRVVFAYQSRDGGNYVIKLAKNSLGVDANRFEYNFYKQNPGEKLAKVVTRSADFSFVVSERLKPASAYQFKKNFGVSATIYHTWCRMQSPYAAFLGLRVQAQQQEAIEQSVMGKSIYELTIKHSLCADTAYRSSYGVDRDGQIKLLDYGCTAQMVENARSQSIIY